MNGRMYNPLTGRWDLPSALGSNPGIGIQRTLDLHSRLPDADIAGARGPGVVPGGENTTGARRVIMDAVDQVAPVPETYRPLAGAPQNNRGRSVTVDLPQVEDPLDAETTTVEVGTIVESGKNAGDDAENIVITCGSLINKDLDLNHVDGSDGYVIVGTIEWGIGGATFQADFDWREGTSFAINASYVRVGARVTCELYSGPRVLTLSAALGYGDSPLANASPVRTTVSILVNESEESTILSLPKFATGLAVSQAGITGSDFDPAVAPNLRITFIGSQGFLAAGQRCYYEYTERKNVANQGDCMFPIPGWASGYTVTNLSATKKQYAYLVFALSL